MIQAGDSKMSNVNLKDVERRLREAGLRPTRQRLALAELLFGPGHRHVTAEQLHREARDAGQSISLATIYNTLNQFTQVGLLREVVTNGNHTFYDTNTADHHHFYWEEQDMLIDIPGDQLRLESLPPLPEGKKVTGVDIIIRLANEA